MAPSLDMLVVCIAAFLASGLTLFSGFGLGTLMLPVFALFLPVHMAVVATALVHGANNVFKVSLLGRHADRDVVLRFGVPAIIAAIAGAALLGWVTRFGASVDVLVNEQVIMTITPVKFLIGLMMIGFAIFELLPRFRQLKFDQRYLPLGGLLSGFFGGLSGHQGALRSAFLAKTGLTTERFVGSNAVIGFLVDLTRIVVYVGLFSVAATQDQAESIWPLVIAGSVAAFLGVMVGRRYVEKVTMKSIQILVGLLLFAVGLGLVSGVL